MSHKQPRRLVSLRLIDADLPVSGRDCGKGPFMDGNQLRLSVNEDLIRHYVSTAISGIRLVGPQMLYG